LLLFKCYVMLCDSIFLCKLRNCERALATTPTMMVTMALMVKLDILSIFFGDC